MKENIMKYAIILAKERVQKMCDNIHTKNDVWYETKQISDESRKVLFDDKFKNKYKELILVHNEKPTALIIVDYTENGTIRVMVFNHMYSNKTRCYTYHDIFTNYGTMGNLEYRLKNDIDKIEKEEKKMEEKLERLKNSEESK